MEIPNIIIKSKTSSCFYFLNVLKTLFTPTDIDDCFRPLNIVCYYFFAYVLQISAQKALKSHTRLDVGRDVCVL